MKGHVAMKLEQIKDATRRLNDLMSDPQPGLGTWCTFMGKVLDELAEHAPSFERIESVSVTTDDKRIAEQFLTAICGVPKDGHPPQKVTEMARIVGEIRGVCGV